MVDASGTGVRTHEKTALVLAAHKDINKSVSQKSVISKVSGSGQESKNQKHQECMSLRPSHIKTPAAGTLISGGCFGWRGVEGGLHIQINRPSLGQSSCLRAD